MEGQVEFEDVSLCHWSVMEAGYSDCPSLSSCGEKDLNLEKEAL